LRASSSSLRRLRSLMIAASTMLTPSTMIAAPAMEAPADCNSCTVAMLWISSHPVALTLAACSRVLAAVR
jgi:hypothetical protein